MHTTISQIYTVNSSDTIMHAIHLSEQIIYVPKELIVVKFKPFRAFIALKKNQQQYL